LNLNKIVELANTIINIIDRNKLASNFGVKIDSDDPQQIKLRAEQEKK